jgi:hypothetical protein
MFVTYLGPTEWPQTVESNFSIKGLFDSNKLQNASNAVQTALNSTESRKG